MKPLLAGVEAGGTKFVCAVGTGPHDIRAETRFPTTSPDKTIDRAVRFINEQQRIHGPLAGVGVASFGPVDPNPNSPYYGHITSTPKIGWSHTDVAGAMRRAVDLPVGFDNDVNAAALAERRWGAAQGLETFIYLTIGTGIGGGVVTNGRLVYGLVHPEMGHILLPHDLTRDPYPGHCPFHGDCLEGLASGPAMRDRWGCAAETLPKDHPAWELEAHYLASALVNFICTLSPERIVMGGGVMAQSQLFPLIRHNVQQMLNGYVESAIIQEQIDAYIVPAGLGVWSGVLGALILAETAANEKEPSGSLPEGSI